MTSTTTAATPSPVMFCHVNQHPQRRFTLAYVETDTKFVASIAVCSATDQFTKKIGRQLSSDRLAAALANGVGKHSFEILKANFPRLDRRTFLHMAISVGYSATV